MWCKDNGFFLILLLIPVPVSQKKSADLDTADFLTLNYVGYFGISTLFPIGH
jgi:hypothetical protein